MDIKEIDILGAYIGEHWYYRAKLAALRRLLAGVRFRRILDVGAGSGFFSRELLRSSDAQEVVCVDTSYPEAWSEGEGDKTIHFQREVDAVTADLVLLMDLLEHVEDDVGLLLEYVKKAPSGAKIVVSVPAFSFLWSGHDLFLEHKRRYTLAQTEAVMRSAGLVVDRGCYFFATVFPLAVLRRLGGRLRGGLEVPRSDLQRHSRWVNALLFRACWLELPWVQYNRLFGLSVFCVAHKP